MTFAYGEYVFEVRAYQNLANSTNMWNINYFKILTKSFLELFYLYALEILHTLDQREELLELYLIQILNAWGVYDEFTTFLESSH